MIHGVMSDKHESRWVPLRWQLSPQVLDKHFRTLSKYYEFVSVDEAMAMLSGKVPARKNALLVTIDDGYKNARTHALPVLAKFGVRPILFVVSGMFDNNDYFWFDRLDLCLQETAKAQTYVEFAGRYFDLNADDRPQLRETCHQIIKLSRELFDDENNRNDALMKFMRGLDEMTYSPECPKEAVDQWIGVMTKEEVGQALEDGMDIGSHTVSHCRLPALSEDHQKEELARSKADIESVTNERCRYFCYPEGSIGSLSATFVANANYDAAFTCEAGLTQVGANPMLINRIHLPADVDHSELLATVSGLRESINCRKREWLGWLQNIVSRKPTMRDERAIS